MKYFTRYITIPADNHYETREAVYSMNAAGDLRKLQPDLEFVQKTLNKADGYKPVKLVLCSRDIKIGDVGIATWTKKNGALLSAQQDLEYVNNNPSGWANLKNKKSSISHPLKFEYSKDELHGFESDIFKVIGEVSKEAQSYVKENQEFSEEDVKLNFHEVYKCLCKA